VPPSSGDTDLLLQDETSREITQRNYDSGSHVTQLGLEPRRAGLDLIRKGVSIGRRAALQDVDDGHTSAVEPDLTEQLVEQLTRRPHEGPALLVLVEAGGLPDEAEVRVEVAVGPHDLGPALSQSALGANQGLLADSRDVERRSSWGRRKRHVCDSS